MEKNTNDIPPIKVGIVDDHESIAMAYAGMLNTMKGIRATLQAYSGEELLEILKTTNELPDIILMDVDMDDMNGIEATKDVTELYPTIKIIAFTHKKDEWTILQMIGAGACAYLTKKIKADKMREAIHEVYNKGKYQADLFHLHSAELRQYSQSIKDLFFTESEKRYLQLLCKGFDYNHIASSMGVSLRSINYYCSSIAQKLNTKSHVLMALVALRMGIVNLYEDKKP